MPFSNVEKEGVIRSSIFVIKIQGPYLSFGSIYKKRVGRIQYFLSKFIKVQNITYAISELLHKKQVKQFDLVCRAHMVVEDGYEFFNDRSSVTVFSAPNYCGEFDNWGAVMSVSEELLCSFELLDPLDSVALKRLMKQGRIERRKASMARTNSESTQSY